jgi:hypothetical protein
MQDIDARVQQLLAESEHLPLSSLKLELLQEAVRLADAHQRTDLGIEARWPLMIVARNLLRGDVLTVAFTWCLAEYDRDPTQYHGQDLFWHYQMVIGQLANLPDVSRAKLEELLDDLGRRLQVAGRSRLPVYIVQRSIAADLGDRALARAANESIRRLQEQGKRDFANDRFDEIETEVFLGDEERALQLAQPMLKGNFARDRAGAETAYAGLLLPLLKRQRFAEADHLERRCLRSFHPEQCYYWWHGDLLKWLTLTNQLARAVPAYEECQRAIHVFTDPLTRLHFALDALVLFDRLRREERRTLPLRLPDGLPVSCSDGYYEVEAIDEWLHREAAELAERFDRRNGTNYFREQIQERKELQRWARAPSWETQSL